MDKLRELQQEYLKKVMLKTNITNTSALAKAIGIWPSTFNKFIKEGAKAQQHLSALTLDKLYIFSGIAPPTTSLTIHTSHINEKILCEAIKEIMSIIPPHATIEDKAFMIIRKYNDLLKEGVREKKNSPAETSVLI